MAIHRVSVARRDTVPVIRSGIATPGAALQDAIDTCTPFGGVIEVMGAHTWESVPALPVKFTFPLVIQGVNNATVTLTSGAPRFLDFDKTADHQTFGNVIVHDITINDAGVGGGNHKLIGSYINSGSVDQYRMNFEDITVRRCKVINAPLQTTGAFVSGVGLMIHHQGRTGATLSGSITFPLSAATVNVSGSTAAYAASGTIAVATADGLEKFQLAYTGKTSSTFTGVTGGTASTATIATATAVSQSEATQNWCKRITVEDFEMDGGHQPVAIEALGGAFAAGHNAYFDEIAVRRCRMTQPSIPIVPSGSSNVIIGNAGYCGKVTVSDVYGENSSDDFIEVNAGQDVLIERCHGLNSGPIVSLNYHPLADVSTARMTLRDCYVKATTKAGLVLFGGAYPQGELVLDSCTFEIDGVASTSLTSTTYAGMVVGATTGFRVVRLIDCKMVVKNLNADQATTKTMGLVSLNSGVRSGVAAQKSLIYSRGLGMVVSGTDTGAGQALPVLMQITGTDVTLDIDPVEIDLAVTSVGGTGSTIGVYVGQSGTNTIRGRVGANIQQMETGDTNPTGVKFGSSSALTPDRVIRVEGHYTKMTAGADISVVSNDPVILSKLDIKRVNPRTAPTISTVPVATSGTTAGCATANDATHFYWRNLTGRPVSLMVIGGTVSGIELSQDGTTFLSGYTSSDNDITLANSEAVKITYSVAPGLRARPMI